MIYIWSPSSRFKYVHNPAVNFFYHFMHVCGGFLYDGANLALMFRVIGAIDRMADEPHAYEHQFFLITKGLRVQWKSLRCYTPLNTTEQVDEFIQRFLRAERQLNKVSAENAVMITVLALAHAVNLGVSPLSICHAPWLMLECLQDGVLLVSTAHSAYYPHIHHSILPRSSLPLNGISPSSSSQP